MRQFLGTAILLIGGIAFLGNGSLFGLILLAFAISAIVFFADPASPAGMPGGMVAMAIGTVVAVLLFAAVLGDFFDAC